MRHSSQMEPQGAARAWPGAAAPPAPKPPLALKRASVYRYLVPRRSPSLVLSALDDYLASADFGALAATTRTEYERIADHLRQEIGGTQVAEIGLADIRRWRDIWSRAGYRAAGLRLQVLSNALKPFVADGVLPPGLFVRQLRVRRPHDRPEPNRAWTDEEVRVVINECVDRTLVGLARAVALGRYAGLRRQTLLTISRSHRVIVERPGEAPERRIRILSAKGKVKLDIPEDPLLTQCLDEETCDCGENLVFNARGQPYTKRAINQALTRVVDSLVARREVGPGLTLHGLRHARGVELAHSGSSDAHLMAQLGHTDEQSARVYRRQAMSSRLADESQRQVDEYRLRRAAAVKRTSKRPPGADTLPLPFEKDSA